MKTIYRILLVCILLQSCSTKDCIELEDNEPIQTSCDTGLLLIRSELNAANQTVFSLDSIEKPVNTPLLFNNIQTEAQANFFQVMTRPSNYDAYNAANETYFIEFPEQQRLFKYDINTQTRQEFTVAGFYSAPVFNNGNLYAITIDNFGYATDPANFSIEIINQNDGSLTTSTTSSFPLISIFNWESMSSATDNNGMIYFVSGTNLISFNNSSSVASHTELVPTFDLFDNNQLFYGLELRNNGNLLAIRERNDDLVTSHELVEIDSSNPSAAPIVIFDFMANGIEPNSEFYSTTYDSCDDTYYVTTINGDFNTTDFYEIDLVSSTVKTENFNFYLMGIESKNN